MKYPIRHLGCAVASRSFAASWPRRLALAALLGLAAFASPESSQPAVAAPAGSAPTMESVASLRPEVRLRKLHLVRPDLIQYPLSYDIYC